MRRSPSAPPELPGYTFVKLLGSGGFSDVFLYDQHLPRRRVAVKVLLTDDITDASRAALVAEANLMAQLSAHPYIVTIYQADVAADDRPYFVMEYCSGASLAERYKREIFAVEDALRTGVRLSSAVATAHAAGILHRDIKPANVLSNDYGWPALTDFGISSALEDELPMHTAMITGAQADAAEGTMASVGMSVPWSPPEMFEDDPQPDVHSDVFSLAATIHTILAGRSPFEVPGRPNSTLDLIGRIERGAITPMGRDDVPRSLLAVLAKGMASARRDRFTTAVDFARALQRVELELGYSPTPIDVPNLLVAAPIRGAEGEDDNETKVRTVATIDAQPITSTSSAATSSAASSPQENIAAASTVVRGAQSVDAQPARGAATEFSSETVLRPRGSAASSPEPQPAPAAPPQRSRRRSIFWWVVVVAASVLAVVVALALIFVGAPAPGDRGGPPATRSAPPVLIDSVPTPQLAAAPVVEGSTITFMFTNPSPKEGDLFTWRISNRTTDEPVRKADGNSVIVTDYVPGSTVCVEVTIVRAGKLSANPYESCYPA
ncbi:MAG: serine/threonine-protein kinase [Rhodoglobus sp.]